MNLIIVRNRKLWKPPVPPVASAPALPGQNVKRFDAAVSFEAPDAKAFTEVKGDGGVVIDFQNVRIKGYLSTFKGYTEMDRQGDYIEPGAFTETLKTFMKNPVMLRDHINMTSHLVGAFTVMQEDQKGLYFEATLSNSPDVRDVRFKVAEGFLKTTSIGGYWHYKEDGRGIFRADLWEGSITPVPANPDAIFQTRSLNKDDVSFLKSIGRTDIIEKMKLAA